MESKNGAQPEEVKEILEREQDALMPYRLSLTERLALKDILKRKQEHEQGLAQANRDFQQFLVEKGLKPNATYQVMPDEMAIMETQRK